MEVLVISGGSSRKRFGEPPLSCRDLDETSRSELVENHPELTASAGDLYTGPEHETVAEAVNSLREIASVDWKILSAGYGLVGQDTELAAYDCSFNDIDRLRARAESMGVDAGEMTHAEVRQAVGRALEVPETLHSTLEADYDLVLCALSSNQFEVIQPGLADIDPETTAIAIAAEGVADSLGPCRWVPATDRERRLLGSSWVELRGDLLANLVDTLDDASSLQQLTEEPASAYFRSLGMS